MEAEKIDFTECTFDTNVVLRWLIADNLEQSTKVDKLLENTQLKKIHIPDVVVAEVVWVLESVYKFERNDVIQALDTWFSHSKFVYNKSLFNLVIQKYQTKTALSFIDLMLLTYTKINKAMPLVTFDKNLAKQEDFILKL